MASIVFGTILVLLKFANAQRLESCSVPTLSPKLCLTKDAYLAPGEVLEDLPIRADSSIDLYDIVDVDIEKHSITVHLDLGIVWNDTYVSLNSPANK